MHDAELMQVLDSQRDLVCQVLHSLLRQAESSFLDIIEEVLTLHVVQHNEVLITILEEVNELDDVVVLTHLELLNLASLLEDLNWLHVGLLDHLDGHILLCLPMNRQLNQAELALAQVLPDIVEVEYVAVAHSLLETLFPAPLHI